MDSAAPAAGVAPGTVANAGQADRATRAEWSTDKGFIPPPYPHDRLGELAAIAKRAPGGMVDCSVGTPCDPMPEVAVQALHEAIASGSGVGYPATIGSQRFREAACGWLDRRLRVAAEPEQVISCVGTKEFVASLPRMIGLRDPSRDTVLYPAVSYPTYAMGATLAGLRAVPVPLDGRWHLDLDRVDEQDARRALLLWMNEPGNPTGSAASEGQLQRVVEWGRARGVIVASDECYVEFTYDGAGHPAPPQTALAAGAEGLLCVHSLSKRSNMAGMRAGFVVGDRSLVGYLGEMRKHAGLMTPAPVQAAAAAALTDDAAVNDQRERYAERRRFATNALGKVGLEHVGGTATFYLWLQGAKGSACEGADGWEIAGRMATTGTLGTPGDIYGPDGAAYVRLALVQPMEQIELACRRIAEAFT